MSEYGSVIGGVVGAVIGAYAGGNAYMGWMIGSALGGAYSTSKQVIPGPKIGDSQKQWAVEGAPIPIVYGYSPPIQGTVVADMDEPLIVTKRERQGKGGPKVESESAYRTYAIMFCEGETQLRQAWKNGRLVYDATNPAMAADNAEFLRYATWLSGSYDQMPHPALEELYGAGNAPAFRGRSVLVLDKEDVTDTRGSRNQWHVRVFRGAAKSYTTPPYPVYWSDPMRAVGRIQGAATIEATVEHLQISASPIGGVIRATKVEYDSPADELEVGARSIGGVIYIPIVEYAFPPEAMGISAWPVGGFLKVTLMIYSNYKPEELEISSKPIAGAIT